MEVARQAGITVVSLPMVNQWTQVSHCLVQAIVSCLTVALHDLSMLCAVACIQSDTKALCSFLE